jgi:HlyD family secretion protein
MKMNAKYIKLAIFIPVVIVLAAVIVLIIRAVMPDKYIVTGMVEVDEIDVASKIPGRVDSVFVQEGDKVTRGQILAKLGSTEIDAKVEQARGAMDAARAKMEMAHNGARPEEKEAIEKLYMQAKHQYELAEKTYNRVDAVYKDSVISDQEHDQVEFQYKAAREQMEAAKAKYDMTLKGVRNEEIAAAEGLYHQAENAMNEALSYQAEACLKSPIDGEVCKKITNPGEMAAAGYPLFTVINPTDIWVVAQIREDKMSSVKMDAITKVDIPGIAAQNQDFKVTYIAPMAEFATWKATNQKGDFDLKTFEVHLRPLNRVPNLRAGMTARISF